MRDLFGLEGEADSDLIELFVGYARTATRLNIDVVTMLWAPDVDNIARFAQANISAWDESNAIDAAKAKAEAKNKTRRR